MRGRGSTTGARPVEEGVAGRRRHHTRVRTTQTGLTGSRRVRAAGTKEAHLGWGGWGGEGAGTLSVGEEIRPVSQEVTCTAQPARVLATHSPGHGRLAPLAPTGARTLPPPPRPGNAPGSHGGGTLCSGGGVVLPRRGCAACAQTAQTRSLTEREKAWNHCSFCCRSLPAARGVRLGGQNCRPLDVIGQKSRTETVKIWRTKPRKKTIGSKPKKSEVHNAAPPRRQTCTACVFGVQDTVAVRLRRGGAADGERGLNTPADSPSSRISRSKHRLGGSVAGGGWGCAGGREWASPPTPRGRAMGGGHLGGAGSGGCAGHGAGCVGAHLLALLIVIAITDAPWACRRVGPPSSCREGGKPRGVRQTRTFGQKRACFPRTQQRKRCAARVHISKHMRGTRSVRGNTRCS